MRSKTTPEFYNTLTTNCTTNIWLNTRVNPDHLPFSWKILVSGYIPEYLYETGRLDNSLPFSELEKRAHVNARAHAADAARIFRDASGQESPLNENTKTLWSIHHRIRDVLAAFLFAAALPAKADESAGAADSASGSAKRPKICLVLSGGGARGAAHVGVIKVLEEYRVPIHCIAGNSMGALVGAAYATGTTVAEMDEILAGISTELLFKEKPPRKELAMRRKQDDYTILFGPEVGIRDGKLTLPKGVVSGVQLETVLRRLSKEKGYFQFDKLPIPYRAVATDLATGKVVVFSEGELANVMRASMSVPVAIDPVEISGKLLVDGMLTQNLPVETGLTMGPDIIIAVNVGTPLLKRDELNSVLGVSAQVLSILTEQNVQTSLSLLKPGDILITPDLGNYSTGDFDNLPQISPLGEEAARKVGEQLAKLSIPAEEYAALRRRQMVASIPSLQPVDEIRFENLKRVNPETVQEVMETQAGQPIHQEMLDRDMRRIYGTG